MPDALDDKRTATRLRILVEIAERQPAVSQGEIADVVGVTSQAVSEYIRGLVEDGLVEKDGRSRYRVTNEGVDWLLQETADLRHYAEHVAEDVLGGYREDAAIATDDVETGETVTLSLVDGLLHATPEESGPATGVATTDAAAGEDVGVTGFEGVIDLDPETVTVYQVPRVRDGGSRGVDADALREACAGVDLVLASGVEAVVALRAAGVEPAVTVGVGTVAAEAAARGQSVAVVASQESVGRITQALRDAEATYEVTDVES